MQKDYHQRSVKERVFIREPMVKMHNKTYSNINWTDEVLVSTSLLYEGY